MCAHIGQNRHIYPPSIFRLHFDSRHPPPIPQVDGGGCYREKFFLIFIFLILARIYRMFGLRKIFLFFSLLRSYSDSYSILFRIYFVFTH